MIRKIWNVRSTREDPAQATLIQKSTNAETQPGFTNPPGNSNSSSIKQQNLQEKPQEQQETTLASTLTENANNSEKDDSQTDMNQKSGATTNAKSLEEEEKENLNEVNKETQQDPILRTLLKESSHDSLSVVTFDPSSRTLISLEK